MKLAQLLEKYDGTVLDHISADKVDEAISLRLPQPVIVQEIISALGSQSYIAGKVLYGKPPMFAILNLILQSPGYRVDVDGLFDQTMQYVNELSRMAGESKSLLQKNASLYIKILRKALETDSIIDKNEGHILELVRQELGIWDLEHQVMLHHESILSLWNLEQEFYLVRNQLLSNGILLTDENQYVIAEEVAVQLRRTFGLEMMNAPFSRLLNTLTKEDLAMILNYFQLNISGSKEVQVDRLIRSLIPPSELLNVIHLENLKEICRHIGIISGGSKQAVINNIIGHFDLENDLKKNEPEETETLLPKEPEVREMETEVYTKLLQNLTGQQLYDILFQSELMTSGSKEEKVKRILESPWAERFVFNRLRKEDMSQLCRRFGLPVSGSKQELIDRLLDYTLPSAADDILIQQQLVAEQPGTTQPFKNPAEEKTEPAALPVNFGEISEQFPELDYDEKIILSILKEVKTLTEQDIHRIVVKHKLGWFLYKAGMAELMARLRTKYRPLIQIKSVPNSNIYQWITTENASENQLGRKAARDIIDALRHGVVPRNKLNLLMVGQETARAHLSEILLEVTANKSHFKFIRGQYGSGKTFLCSWLKEFALENEFVVSFLNVSNDQPLSDLPVFYSGMINALRTPEKTDSGAMVDILESWLLNIHNKTARIESLNSKGEKDRQQLAKIVEVAIEAELAELNDIEPGFSRALRSFYQGKITGNAELVSNAVAWITGSRSLSAQAVKEIGVRGFLEAGNVFQRMRAILNVITGGKYKGLLLLVDELELVRKFPHARQREQALETLRLLIDEAGKNALPGCLTIFTGTDEFFEDERYGLKSYEALAERVMTPILHDNFVSMRQPIISLESLDRERLTQVIFKVRELYGIAYNWDCHQFASDESIHKLLEEWTLFGDETIDRKPRPVLREFIQMLDLCEENKGVHLSEFLKKSALQPIPGFTVAQNMN